MSAEAIIPAAIEATRVAGLFSKAKDLANGNPMAAAAVATVAVGVTAYAGYKVYKHFDKDGTPVKS